MLHVVDDAALVQVGELLLAAHPLVDEGDLQALVQEGHGLQPLEHGPGPELGAFGGEDRAIGPERDRGAALAATRRGLADGLHLARLQVRAGDDVAAVLGRWLDHDRGQLQTLEHIIDDRRVSGQPDKVLVALIEVRPQHLRRISRGVATDHDDGGLASWPRHLLECVRDHGEVYRADVGTRCIPEEHQGELPGGPFADVVALAGRHQAGGVLLGVDDVVSALLDPIGEPRDGITVTGGEPFLQKEEDLKELTDQLYKRGAAVVECFSNGTLLYPEWVNDLNGIHLIMDWKLPSSGEACDDPTRIANLKRLAGSGGHSIKFVIGDRRDYEQAKLLYGDYVEDSYYGGEVYYGVVWNKLTNSELISWVLEDGLPWRLNVQVHNYIYDRRKRGI